MQIAERMGRLGTETAFDVLARAGALQAAGRSIINLGIGQPDFRTPDHIVEAGRKALADGHHGYTPANGIPALREAVAADIATYRHCEVESRQRRGGAGRQGHDVFRRADVRRAGGRDPLPQSGLPIYESAIKFSGATPVPIPLYEETGFSFDADEVLAKITPRTRLVMLNSPANPTGGVVPRETFDRLAQGLEAHPHVAIMSDEIYSRLLYEGREHVTMLDYPALRDRVIVLDGWSKTYAMTGWRIGYGVWPASLAEQATRLAINCNSCVNAPTQHAALAALTGPQESVEIMRRTFDERRRLIVAALNRIEGVTCVDSAGAFYAMPNITGTGLDARTMQDGLLEEAGVATVAGTSFGAYGEGYLRLSYAASTEEIEESIARIEGWLAERAAAA